MTLLAVFISLFFLYSLVSRRMQRTIFTAPIVFTVAGMLMVLPLPVMLGVRVNVEFFLRLAEVGLVLLLFTDASRTDLSLLLSMQRMILVMNAVM